MASHSFQDSLHVSLDPLLTVLPSNPSNPLPGNAAWIPSCKSLHDELQTADGLHFFSLPVALQFTPSPTAGSPPRDSNKLQCLSRASKGLLGLQASLKGFKRASKNGKIPGVSPFMHYFTPLQKSSLQLARASTRSFKGFNKKPVGGLQVAAAVLQSRFTALPLLPPSVVFQNAFTMPGCCFSAKSISTSWAPS